MASLSSSSNQLSMFAAVVLASLLMSNLRLAAGQSIGICYGTKGDNLPSAQNVINMYKSLNIGRMRLYNENKEPLEALASTNIEIMLGVPNERIQELASSSAAASLWVQNNVIKYTPGIKFKYIAVGNEEIPSYNAQFILPAMRNIFSAIQTAGLQNQIKVSTAIHMAVVQNSFPPSLTTFKDEAATYLRPIADFLSFTGSPLLANVYPYFGYTGDKNNVPLEYAMFASQGVRFQDGNYQYKNLFDAMVDSLYWALEKAGGSNVEIVVSESGWPSKGGDAATIENAKAYNQKLIEHVKVGTPKKPKSIETYLFAMFNENLKPGIETEKNFGLFYPDQTPVYSINFNG